MITPCPLMIPLQLPYKSHETYLTNHMGSISFHITPLVIIALRANTHAHTRTCTHAHARTHTHTHTNVRGQSNSKKPGACPPRFKSTYLKINFLILKFQPLKYSGYMVH